MPIVTLITDFGTQDGYVGAMKGVILSLSPRTRIVDIAHDVPREDVAHGAVVLAQAAAYYPKGTVHVVVVDPGVGGKRRGVVVDDGRHLFVGPDNGVFSLAVPAPRAAYEIASPKFRSKEVCPTFHGRDVFSPAAARLASGAKPSDAGPAVTLLCRLARPQRGQGAGRVIHVDRFGNLVTDIPGHRLGSIQNVRALRVSWPVCRTFEDVARGARVAYIGSMGTLELAVRDGSAARAYKPARGARVAFVK
ncbi:MAG: SAM-dependent chlorinase/fluorinase [Deltaproteobacteria bacterium]|nr:SAM-dependent chlorinase/fluorinase [Deltaproteobacteria bacterium]